LTLSLRLLQTPRAPVALASTSKSPHQASHYPEGWIKKLNAIRYHANCYRGGYRGDPANSVVPAHSGYEVDEHHQHSKMPENKKDGLSNYIIATG